MKKLYVIPKMENNKVTINTNILLTGSPLGNIPVNKDEEGDQQMTKEETFWDAEW
ncbi:MAG: hypothetical protein KBT12_02480 [Bacteroidales bacterium]|nr:hypothetical protein [Candidatus Physcousia equi]